MLVALSACAGSNDPPPPTAAPSETPAPTLITQPDPIHNETATPTRFVAQRATLPPTWTPTASATITPTASITPTPTTTPSPTVTLTLPPEEICERLFLGVVNTAPERVYARDATIPISLYSGLPNSAIRFEAINRVSERTLTINLPGGFPLIDNLPLSNFPGPGIYDWTIEIIPDDGDPLCTRTGTLTIERPYSFLDQLLDQAEATPEAAP